MKQQKNMINLLPPEEKHKILLDNLKRLITIIWVLALFFLLCLVLIFLSLNIYLKSQAEANKLLLEETQKKIGQSEIKIFQEKIADFNQTISKLNLFYSEKIYFSEVLEKISENLPQKLYLTNSLINRTADKKNEIKISFSGFSPARDGLFEFMNNLKREKKFKDVAFPPANWVKPADIDFFVTLTFFSD